LLGFKESFLWGWGKREGRWHGLNGKWFVRIKRMEV